MNNSHSDSDLSESIDGDESETGSNSNSSSSSSSSSYSSTQSDDEEDNNSQSNNNEVELAQIGSALLRLPRDLCANHEVFEEFFSLETWNILPQELKQTLIPLLPKFNKAIESTEEIENEQQRTIEMLFENKLDCFGFTPLRLMQQQLEAGNYRPDVVKLRKSIAKSTRREQRFQKCESLSYLARELFIKRERLLRNVYKSAAPAGTEPLIIPRQRALNNLCVDNKMYVVRARKRYAHEIEGLLNSVGLKGSDLNNTDDASSENEHDWDLDGKNRQFKTPANTNSCGVTDKCIYGTLFKRRPNMSDEDAFYEQQYAKQPQLNNKQFRSYLQAYKRRKFTEPVCIFLFLHIF